MKRLLFFITGLLLTGALSAQNVNQCEYWFDQDYANHQVVTVVNDSLHWQADASNLSTGLHSLNLHIQDTNGRWSSPRSFMFMHLPTPQSAPATYTCWFDQDNSLGWQTGSLVNGTMMVDATALPTGIHQFNIIYRVGNEFQIRGFMFYKLPEALASTALTFHYRVDGGEFQTAEVTAQGTMVTLNLDMTALEEGTHTIEYYTTNGDNAVLSPLQTDQFERTHITQYYTLTVMSADLQMGTVSPGGEYEENSTVTIEAFPNVGYLFSQWNDEINDNPRIITITSDTTFTAYFNIDVGVDDYTMENILVYGHNGNIMVSFETPMPVWVYDMQGKLLFHRPADGSTSYSIPISTGVYLVKAGETYVKKVVVTE